MRQALCRVAAALRGRPARRQRFPAGMFREVPFSPEPLFYGCAPKKRNHSEARQAVAPGPSPRLLPTATIAPIRFSPPPDESFRKEDGGAGGRRKALFQKGIISRSPSLPSLFFLFPHLTHSRTIRRPGKPLRPAHCRGFCRQQPLLQSAFRPCDKSFRKEDGGRGGKGKSPFSKGFSPSPRSSSPSSLKKSCAEGESEGSAQRGGAAGAAVLLQWVSRRGRRRSGTWCLRRGS